MFRQHAGTLINWLLMMIMVRRVVLALVVVW